jgi:alkylhydroperoxidase family enzyme
MRRSTSAALVLLSIASASTAARSAGDDSRPAPAVPVTRDAMKQTLDDSKRVKPRLPLPPLTEEDRNAKGEWGVVNNGRMRKYYLPPEFVGGGFTREPDAAMSLGYPFQTMNFWIVSRCNNCVYCMGHQESKLEAAGLAEDRIAALDFDWTLFTPAEKAAFRFTRDLTLKPNAIGDQDIAELKKYYSDIQIAELLLVDCNFNAMNRWTGALRIPQEEHRVYLKPTAAKYQNKSSLVAPLSSAKTDRSGTTCCAAPADRPPLESRAEVESRLEACRKRTPRLTLLDEAEARNVLKEESAEPLPEYVRLLARFPKAGVARINIHRASETKGSIEPRLRGEIAWIAARRDRAWYALGHALKKLRSSGVNDDAIFDLGTDRDRSAPEILAVHHLTSKLTEDPALVDDADVERVREHFGDRKTAEIIFLITEAAFFDRLTEAAGLRLESK